MAAEDLAAFGRWLRQRREAFDLTQKELAYEVGCSISTLRKMEAGLRRPSRQVAELLATHLQITPDEHQAFMQLARGARILDFGFGVLERSPNRSEIQNPNTQEWQASGLPALLTSFVGREKVLKRICSLLWRVDVRLLTLTGPPGIGKTRLAIEAASDLRSDFADGVFFVSLAPITDPALVLPTVLQLLDAGGAGEQSPEAALTEHLRDKSVLLVLDNFEHVVEAAPVVARVLQNAPRVKALVTSRVPLHLYGEHELVVPPMELPARDGPQPLDDLRRFEAVQLFVRRAQAADLDFTLTDANAGAVAQICRRLDGLPLAIELAASRCKVHGPDAILSRLQDRFALLTSSLRDLPERQRTLRAAMDWSYTLLNGAERAVLRRAGVFMGGFTEDALAAVAEDARPAGQSISDLLHSLVEKSLLTREGATREGATREGAAEEPRFDMLETIHEYALEQLRVAGEEAHARERHARYFCILSGQAGAHMAGPEQTVWLDRIEIEHDNIRAALGWLLEAGRGDPVRTKLALQLATTSYPFWSYRGHFSEGRRWLGSALRNAETVSWAANDRESLLLRSKAMESAGWLAWTQGDSQAARHFFESGLAINRRVGDRQGIAQLLNGLGQVEGDRLEYDGALVLYGEALALARELGDRTLLARTLNNMAGVYRNSLRYAEARRLYEESLTLFRETGDKARAVSPLTNLALVSMDMEDYEGARRYQEEGLALSRELGHKENLVFLSAFVGQRAVEEGDYALACSTYAEILPIVRDLSYKVVLALCLEGMAAMEAEMHEPLKAARLWGSADAVREAIGLPLPLPVRARYESRMASAREESGPERFEIAFAEGHRMALEQAIGYALQQATEAPRRAPDGLRLRQD